MSCERCTADPQPEGFGNPRRCAFNDAGEFTPENWNCATISALFKSVCDARGKDIDPVYGNDESFEYTYVDPNEGDGWIITSRYKTRGCTSSAIWVGDFYPPRPVTLELVERVLVNWATYREWLKGRDRT